MLICLTDFWGPLRFKLESFIYIFVQRSIVCICSGKHLKSLSDTLINIHLGNRILIFPALSRVLWDSWPNSLQRRSSRLKVFKKHLLFFLFFFCALIYWLKGRRFLLLKRCLWTHNERFTDFSFACLLLFRFINTFVLQLVIKRGYIADVSFDEVIRGWI